MLMLELAAQEFMRHPAFTELAPSSQKNFETELRRQILPALGPRPIDTITRREVIDFLRDTRSNHGRSSRSCPAAYRV